MLSNKKIIVLRHGGGRLANQIWNYIGAYTYCLERGFRLENYSFYKYTGLFDLPRPKSFLIKFLFYGFLIKQKWYAHRDPYEKFTRLVEYIFKNRVVKSDETFYLPPSINLNPNQQKEIKRIEENSKTIFFEGWLFRNPIGLKKYQNQIRKYFQPTAEIRQKVDEIVASARKQHSYLVGVHIRQGDYKVWERGEYYFTSEEAASILKDYLQYSQNNSDQTVFLIASDGEIDQNIFQGLNTIICHGNQVEDLWTLSKTDLIIGSDSTYCALAGYLGDTPVAVFKRPKVNWGISNTTGFNYENECTLVHW